MSSTGIMESTSTALPRANRVRASRPSLISASRSLKPPACMRRATISPSVTVAKSRRIGSIQISQVRGAAPQERRGGRALVERRVRGRCPSREPNVPFGYRSAPPSRSTQQPSATARPNGPRARSGHATSGTAQSIHASGTSSSSCSATSASPNRRCWKAQTPSEVIVSSDRPASRSATTTRVTEIGLTAASAISASCVVVDSPVSCCSRATRASQPPRSAAEQRELVVGSERLV